MEKRCTRPNAQIDRTRGTFPTSSPRQSVQNASGRLLIAMSLSRRCFCSRTGGFWRDVLFPCWYPPWPLLGQGVHTSLIGWPRLKRCVCGFATRWSRGCRDMTRCPHGGALGFAERDGADLFCAVHKCGSLGSSSSRLSLSRVRNTVSCSAHDVHACVRECQWAREMRTERSVKR